MGSKNAYRPCATMALFNKAGKVLVAERNDRRKAAWQLPQGGIDKGETVEQAALRELEEEIGTSDAEILAIADKTVCYDWPKDKPTGRRKKWRGQRISLVALQFSGNDQDIDLDTVHPEFRDWRWIALEAIPELIVPFKKPVYEYAVRAFLPVRDQIRQEKV